jgi:hypothetical protein
MLGEPTLGSAKSIFVATSTCFHSSGIVSANTAEDWAIDTGATLNCPMTI